MHDASKGFNVLMNNIMMELKSMPGEVGFYYKNLVTGEKFGFNENRQFLPASIVKLPLLAALMLLKEKGEIGLDETETIHENQKHGGCGVVQHMKGDVTLDLETLYKWMIVISDTTATNAVFRHIGDKRVASAFRELGLVGTQFNRAYYDDVKESQGIQNYFVPREMGELLEKMYFRELVSERASKEIEDILLKQQINHKMGGKLPLGFPIAHKTGEEEDRTHDVGLVYTKEPFVACFASYQVPLYDFEDFIRRTTYELAINISPKLEAFKGVEGYY